MASTPSWGWGPWQPPRVLQALPPTPLLLALPPPPPPPRQQTYYEATPWERNPAILQDASDELKATCLLASLMRVSFFTIIDMQMEGTL